MNKLGFNRLGHFGRHGNQMFQVASVYGIAKKTGHTPCANLSQSTLKDCFEMTGIEDSLVESGGVYMENKFSFNERTFDFPSDININCEGYYQTEKYFKHCESDIRDMFTFKENIRHKAGEVLPSGVLVSIHVRKTDYVQLKETHHNQSDEYYQKALQKVQAHFGDEVIPVVFSDDIPWCRENMTWLPSQTVFMENDLNVDMCVMSWCNSHIIANSSFSWWGAWLGQGKTIAPKKWFGVNGPQDWQDIYCEGWELL